MNVSQALEKFKNKTQIIWDWNGTLLDDLDDTVAVGNKLLLANDMKEVSVDYYLQNFCFPVSEYYRVLGFDVDDRKHFSNLCHSFVKTYMKDVSNCQIKPEMLSIVKKLNEQGIKQSILSASEQQVLNQMLKVNKVESYFDQAFGLSDKSATCKKERGRELIQPLLKIMKSEDILMVGDTLHDLEVGKDNGIDVLLVAHGHNSLKRLQAGHDNLLIFD